MKTALTLEALQVIDAIERKGSFAAAATVLHRVPSALSYTVQKLEQDLGVTLFRKEGRRAVLTTAGRHLVERGRLLLQAADTLAADTRQIATGWEPQLRIAIDTAVALGDVLPAIAALYDQQPAIEVTLTTEVLGGTWEALLEDRVDLVIGGIEEMPGHKGLRCEPWQTIRHVFVAAPGHPVCQAPQPLTQDTIKAHRAVIIRDTSRNNAPLSRGILNPQQFIEVPDMAAKVEAQRQGLGVGYVPLASVTQAITSGALVELSVEEQRAPETTFLGWRSTYRGRALSFLIDTLRLPEAHAG